MEKGKKESRDGRKAVKEGRQEGRKVGRKESQEGRTHTYVYSTLERRKDGRTEEGREREEMF